jgi:hypothetical protein
MTYTAGGGDTGTVPLIAEKLMNGGIFTGMVHIYGVINVAGNAMDMFWPVVGRKATYVISTALAGTVYSVGEASITE